MSVIRSFFALSLSGLLVVQPSIAQPSTETIDQLLKEVNEHSALENLGMQLMDDIGPRLIGSPQMLAANEWIVNTYKSWGIEAWSEEYGVWKAWERGSTSVEMTSPRLKPLEAIQLAWCPTTRKPVHTEVIMLPEFKDSMSFVRWLPQVKGKIVLISKPELSGRPEDNWKTNALAQDYDAFLKRKKEHNEAWNENLKRIGLNMKTLPQAMEDAGAAALISTYWAGGWGAQRIFAARTEKIPNVNVSLEDYNLLCRYIQRGITPQLKIATSSKDLGMNPALNTFGMIKGNEHPEEYIFLSAHLDSWDAATGATDNGTGTILMMEVMRILKKIYPNPKRSIIVGHWGGEEQGLNGSKAYVADHPDMMSKISVLFNQDNGTGRINWINGNGFLDAYDYFRRWMAYLPEANRNEIKTDFPGNPGKAGSDYAPFVASGVPAFFLIGHSWDYGSYTWHTQIDTYDKIVFEDVRKNAETIAIMVYLACEEPEMFSRRKAQMPVDVKTGKQDEWPQPGEPNRDGNY